MVFLFSKDAIPLLEAIAEEPGLQVTLQESLGKCWNIITRTRMCIIASVAKEVSTRMGVLF